jgi:glyoxylase-like metal-dependent hydrolase (beta-lactamase superfamily II)
MIVETLVVGLLQTNSYVIVDEGAGEGAVIDPGGDAGQIVDTVRELGTRLDGGLTVKYVVDTHAHFDHVLDNGKVVEQLSRLSDVPPKLVVHAQAAPLLSAGGGARWFGFQSAPSPEPDLLVEDGDVLSLGQLSFQVMHTPGHSPGSITLYCAEEKALFVGDVLFRQGVGRPDLPGGDWATLMDTIRTRLYPLPTDTVVYPGHGPATTIGREIKSNPYVGGA